MSRFLSGMTGTVLVLLVAIFGTTMTLQTMLTDSMTASTLFSPGIWFGLVEFLGGSVRKGPTEITITNLDFFPLLMGVMGLTLVCWGVGSFWMRRRIRIPFSLPAERWGMAGGVWWLLPVIWEVLRLLMFLLGLEFLEAVLLNSPPFWFATALAGSTATLWFLVQRSSSTLQKPVSLPQENYHLSPAVWVASLIFVATFLIMNVQLYRGLWIPHGDSAMYEEHLWNFTHGKGFRSYLDQGLFLGEHIQVIHLLLVPLHLLWPSHLLLEVAETLALASGCIPIFWLTRRHTGSATTGALLAGTYLLYFPLQFLDIAIDLKTFRPISFGVPLLLFAFDQMERGRKKTTILLLVLTLACKEDYCLVLAPWGMWLALFDARHRRFGVITLTLTTVYLLFVTRVAIPWFRGGEEVHYARYFDQFGESLGQIAWNMLMNPGKLWNALVTQESVFYLLCILVPLAWLPLLSPTRFAVGLPILVLLCLNQIARDPRHHFHAPLIPILFWAAALGLGNLPRITAWIAGRSKKATDSDSSQQELFTRISDFLPRFAVTSGCATCLFFSMSPLGLSFWSADSHTYWRRLYLPGERAKQFPKVFEQIPRNARVASTDFVHTRFTHFERSYDYSDYARKVSGYRLTVPEDTDYIVIDTQHPYSKIQSPEEIPEYREHPEDWELLPDETQGYFIVLKRRE